MNRAQRRAMAMRGVDNDVLPRVVGPLIRRFGEQYVARRLGLTRGELRDLSERSRLRSEALAFLLSDHPWERDE